MSPGIPLNLVFAFGGTKFPLYPELLITMPSYHKIASLMDQFRPDIVHLATEFSLGWQGMKYALRHDLPVTSTYHTNFVQYLRYYKLAFFWKNRAGDTCAGFTGAVRSISPLQ